MVPAQPSGGAIKWLVIGCLGCSGLLVFGFIALVLLGALSSIGDSTESSGGTSPSASSASDGGGDPGAIDEDGPDEEDGPTESATADPPAAGTPSGMSGESDGSAITVTSTERTQELSDSLWESTTSNEYFVVNIDYTNKSEESQDLWANDFILVGTDGKEYSSNTDASLAVEDPLIIEEVNPGLTISGTLIFEVPPGTEFTEMRLQESFGTSTSLTVPFP
ncbi:MAG: DUF4352 domain-containing protein [Brachybacterium tyrofermentans]|uniref:DUF4352 domain-containing protein n=1 Tax=Brachybacterium TaxID=43668 RepID=UPI003FB6DFFA